MSKITYYKSAICPRCLPTDRLMDRIRAARPALEIETIEVLKHPGRAIQDRVMTLPTIIVGGQRWFGAVPLPEILDWVDSSEDRKTPIEWEMN
jgi:glutaredoxin